MWTEKRVFSIIVCVVLMSLMFFPIDMGYVSGEGDDHILEGIIYDESEIPIAEIDVVITNLDTEDYTTVETDQDGYYSVNFEELAWTIPFKTRVKTIDPPETDYLDACIEYSIEERIYGYEANMYLIESPQLEKRAQYTIPVGTFELYETGTFNAATQYTKWYPSDYTNVTSNLQKQINPTMTLRLKYWRNDGYQHEYYYYIQTRKMWPGGINSKYDKSGDYTFTGMRNASHSASHVYQHPNIGKYWMETCGGFYIQVYNTLIEKWEPDGDGCGVKGYGANFV